MQTDNLPHIAIDVPDATEDAPPPFALYEAEYWTTDQGNIISHDPHLNQDGEALYRFLLEQANTPPNVLVSCNGTHTERSTRTVYRNGQQRVESYTVTVTDFDFSIDLTKLFVSGPHPWSFSDSDPAYRGLMVRQVMDSKSRRKATSDEISIFKSHLETREEKGLPPWQDSERSPIHEKSSKTVREWADEYAASPKLLKELVYVKVPYGWNFATLEAAIRNAIAKTHYRGTVAINFDVSSDRVCIRPDNRLSRTLSYTFYKVLLWLFLIYPFIWLFKRYNSRGGGRWETCGAAYAFKVVEPLNENNNNIPDEDPEDGQLPWQRPIVVNMESDGTSIPMRILGMREGEWFRQWDPVIQQSVVSRLQRSEPLVDVLEGPTDPAQELDGYA